MAYIETVKGDHAWMERPMKIGTRSETTLKALRDHAEGETIDGWRDVYLDNAKASDECSDLSRAAFRGRLAKLSALGLYRPIDGFAWGQVRMGG